MYVKQLEIFVLSFLPKKSLLVPCFLIAALAIFFKVGLTVALISRNLGELLNGPTSHRYEASVIITLFESCRALLKDAK